MGRSKPLRPICNYRCVAAGHRNRCALIYLWCGWMGLVWGVCVCVWGGVVVITAYVHAWVKSWGFWHLLSLRSLDMHSCFSINKKSNDEQSLSKSGNRSCCGRVCAFQHIFTKVWMLCMCVCVCSTNLSMPAVTKHVQRWELVAWKFRQACYTK